MLFQTFNWRLFFYLYLSYNIFLLLAKRTRLVGTYKSFILSSGYLEITKTIDDNLSTGFHLERQKLNQETILWSGAFYIIFIFNYYTTVEEKNKSGRYQNNDVIRGKRTRKTNSYFLLLAYYSLEYSLLVPLCTFLHCLVQEMCYIK